VASSPTGGSDALASCLAAKRTPVIEQNLWLFDADYYKRLSPYLYQPGRMSPTRWVKAYVAGLHGAGFFTGAKTALVRFDAPVFERLAKTVLKPALAARKVTLTEEIAISSPASLAEFGGAASEMGAAILRLRAAGVNRVIFLENAGIMPFFWLPAAEAQGYHPRYGLSSNDIPTTLSSQNPAAQLKGAQLVGWTPSNDVYPRDRTKTEVFRRCDRIMELGRVNRAGPIYTFFTDAFCDSVFFLQAAVPKMTAGTPEALARATEQLGTSYASPVTFTTRFGPGRYDGAGAVRMGAFVESCTCFRYTSEETPVP
jgi:hypothetical protein